MKYFVASLTVIAMGLFLAPSMGVPTRAGEGQTGCPVIREAIQAGCPGVSAYARDATHHSSRHGDSGLTPAEQCPALKGSADRLCPYLRGETQQQDDAAACPYTGKQKTDTNGAGAKGNKRFLKDV